MHTTKQQRELWFVRYIDRHLEGIVPCTRLYVVRAVSVSFFVVAKFGDKLRIKPGFEQGFEPGSEPGLELGTEPGFQPGFELRRAFSAILKVTCHITWFPRLCFGFCKVSL